MDVEIDQHAAPAMLAAEIPGERARRQCGPDPPQAPITAMTESGCWEA